MAAQNEPAGGMDFWAAIGVAPENEGAPDEEAAPQEAAQNGTPAAAPANSAPAEPQTTGQQEGQDDWAALFTAWDDSANGAPPSPPQSNGGTPREQTVAEAAAKRAPASVPFEKPKTQTGPQEREQDPETSQDASAAQAPQEAESAPDTEFTPEAESTDTEPAPEAESVPDTEATPETEPTPSNESTPSMEPARPAQAPAAPAPRNARPAPEPMDGGTAQPAPAADEAWITAEQIANTLRPRLPEIWLEVLTRHTQGDAALASKVYNVLNGSHLLGELMRDKNIDEVHVHGTQVTVCGPQGIRQVPGFPNLAASRRAVKTLAASREKTGIVVSKVNDSVVVSRRSGMGPNTGGLISGGVMTTDQAGRIREALEQMQAVTVTGPAARIVVRALASLIPEGSRVFLGAYAALPAGCVTAASPMEADYVLGVRPGAMAEHMAAAGQVGALIANPETKFPGALQFTITGPSAAPEKLLSG